MANKINELFGKTSVLTCTDSSDTIPNIILRYAKTDRLFCFNRDIPAADAPAQECWDYTYLVMPSHSVVNTFYIVIAFRMFATKIFIRNITDSNWANEWTSIG